MTEVSMLAVLQPVAELAVPVGVHACLGPCHLRLKCA